MALRSKPVARPGPCWQDGFLVLQDSKALSQALAQTGCLEDFGHAHSRAVLLFNYISHTTYVMPTEETTREIFQSNLIDLVLAATSNGLRQLDQQWESPATAGPKYLASLQAVSMLCHTVFRCNITWLVLAANKEAVKAKLSSRAVETGLLTTVSPICNRLLPILQSLQQSANQSPPQLSTSQWDVVVLAQSLLDMWTGLFHAWPGQVLQSRPVAATVEPAAKIALSLLRIQTAADSDATHASSSSSGGNGHSSSSSSYWSLYCMGTRTDLGTSRSLKVAFSLAVPMCALYKEDEMEDESEDPDADDFLIGDSSSRAPACCSSVHVQQLLLAYLAAVAAGQHSELNQSTAPQAAAARQQHQQQVAKQHLKLLAAVNVPAAALMKCLAAAAKDGQLEMQSEGLMDSDVVTAAVIYLLEHLDFRTRQGDSAAEARLEKWSTPVLLTCQELLLLGDRSLPSLGRAFHEFWAAVMATYQHANQAGLVEVLQQLLQSLYPVVVEGFKQYTDGRTTAAARQMYATAVPDRGPEMIAHGLIDQWLVITCTFIVDVNEQDLADIILQEPLPTLAALEAAVRGAPVAAMCLPVLSAFSVASTIIMALPAAVTLLATTTLDHTAKHKQLIIQKQLFSLLRSCYKVAANTSGIRTGVEPALLGTALSCAAGTTWALLSWTRAGLPIGQQSETSPDNSSSRVGASSSSSRADTRSDADGSIQSASLQWLALLGSDMFAAGKLMQQENTDTATGLRITRAWISGFEGQLSLQLPGDPVAAATAEQGLQQKLHDLVALLEGSSISSSRRRTSQLTAQQNAQQLQQFGVLLGGAVPVELCCNNHSCGNLVKLSELELVAGKGSRCSACKVARYCGKDCQKEHWKQHKAACKRLQG